MCAFLLCSIGRFSDLLSVSFYMHDTLRSTQNLSVAPSFGIPIAIIHNSNQTINAHISIRAKYVLAYICIYVALFTSNSTVTAHSHHFKDMFCAKAKAKRLQNHNFQTHPPHYPRSPSLCILCIYIYILIYIYIYIYL